MSTDMKLSEIKERDWLLMPNVVAGISSALAGYMDATSFLNQMLIAFQDEKLIGCTAKSKFEAAHQCAALGLLPSLKQVALIPRDIRDRGLCVTVMPQWQGYQALMLRHPEVLTVKAVLVHVNDSYSYDPLTEQLAHDFDPFDANRKIEKLDHIRGGYLRITYKDGRPPQFHFVTVDTIRKARACAQAKNIWDAWFQEQALKTIYRNAYARRVVPIDHLVHSRLQELVEADDHALGNDPDRVVVVPAKQITEQPSRTSQAMQRMQNQRRQEYADEPKQEAAPEQVEQPTEIVVSESSIGSAENIAALDLIADKLKADRDKMQQEEYDMLTTMIGARRKLLGKK